MVLKKLLNSSEKNTHTRIKEVCEKYDACVNSKVRLADIFPIDNSGISNELYQYALQAHFDFLITDNQDQPLFAVEFDGPSHQSKKQIIRDEKKNTLCEKFKFPLLRVKNIHLKKKYRNFDLLSWSLEVWFYREVFFEAQEQGHIPWDEDFDPKSIMGLPEKNEQFPLWLSVGLRLKIQKLAEAKRIKDISPSVLIGDDKKNNYFGLIWLLIDEEKVVFSESAIRAQNFPIMETELLDELLIFELYEKLVQVLEGDDLTIPIQEIDKQIKTFSQKYRMVSYSGHIPQITS